MEPYRVFISSIMNRALEDLTTERNAARAGVEQFVPVTMAWAFEEEPASSKPLLDFYLDGVKTADLFLLILAENVTKPVQEEYRIACEHGKPMLIFCKDVATRKLETAELLRSIAVKYDAFANAVELREKIRRSLGQHLLQLIRGEAGGGNQLGDRIARLRRFSSERKLVAILPTVPRSQYNSFTVEEVKSTSVTFQKNGIANVAIPLERIEDVLETDAYQAPTIHLNGRLQWITSRQNWIFRPEKPRLDDPLGIGLGREVARESPLAEETLNRLQQSHRLGWLNPRNVPGREVFFDNDGFHLTSGGQILTLSRVSA